MKNGVLAGSECPKVELASVTPSETLAAASKVITAPFAVAGIVIPLKMLTDATLSATVEIGVHFPAVGVILFHLVGREVHPRAG
jgi:hypothetical protein